MDCETEPFVEWMITLPSLTFSKAYIVIVVYFKCRFCQYFHLLSIFILLSGQRPEEQGEEGGAHQVHHDHQVATQLFSSSRTPWRCCFNFFVEEIKLTPTR